MYPMRNFYHDTRRVASQGLGGTFSPWGKTGPAGHQPSISKSQKHLFQYSATYSKIQLLDCTNLAINCKNGNGVKISDMMSWSNFFDVVLLLLSSLVTDLSFMSISSLVLELWQFHFIRDWPEIWKSEIPLSEFCPISGDWGELQLPHLPPTSLIKCYWMLQNVRDTAFTVSEE